MTKDPYKPPQEKTIEEVREAQKTPLSQASGKKKLLIGSAFSILCGLLAYFGVISGITKMLSILLAAYALVGLVEVLAGESLVASAKKWDDLASWKKFIISLVVILFALGIFIGAMPLVATFI